MRVILVSKMTEVDKATLVANDITLLRQFVFVPRILSVSVDRAEQKTKFVPVTESAWSTGLI